MPLSDLERNLILIPSVVRIHHQSWRQNKRKIQLINICSSRVFGRRILPHEAPHGPRGYDVIPNFDFTLRPRGSDLLLAALDVFTNLIEKDLPCLLQVVALFVILVVSYIAVGFGSDGEAFLVGKDAHFEQPHVGLADVSYQKSTHVTLGG